MWTVLDGLHELSDKFYDSHVPNAPEEHIKRAGSTTLHALGDAYYLVGRHLESLLAEPEVS
jgi:hypothetical protein